VNNAAFPSLVFKRAKWKVINKNGIQMEVTAIVEETMALLSYCTS